MNDEDWSLFGKGRWYYINRDPRGLAQDVAQIVCAGDTEWQLFINHQPIAAFNSWEEARDATPMMISIHGYKDKS